MLVPRKMISATSAALDNYGIVWIPLWSIVKFILLYNEVSPTGSYILVCSYLYFRASKLKGTRTESTLLDMLPRSFDVNVVCSKTLRKHKIRS